MTSSPGDVSEWCGELSAVGESRDCLAGSSGLVLTFDPGTACQAGTGDSSVAGESIQEKDQSVGSSKAPKTSSPLPARLFPVSPPTPVTLEAIWKMLVRLESTVGKRVDGLEKQIEMLGKQSEATNSESLYQQLRQRMQDISGDGGVLKEVIRAGTGELVSPDASVLVKYSGYLEYSDKPFDTNWYRKNPRLMKLGEDITLGGMEIALLTMQKGEVSRCLFSPAYAYGKMGCPPLIPANATVLFELELLDFLDTAESDSFFDLTPQEQVTFPLEKMLKVANTEREFGNYLFRQSRFYDAKDRYKRAMKILTRQPVSSKEQHLINASRLLVFLNLSLTYLKVDHPSRALVFGERALEIDCKNAKALFRCGQACLIMTEYEKARDFLIAAQKVQPYNQDINNELKKLAGCYKDYMEKQKTMCHRMFASLNSSV